MLLTGCPAPGLVSDDHSCGAAQAQRKCQNWLGQPRHSSFRRQNFGIPPDSSPFCLPQNLQESRKEREIDLGLGWKIPL